MAVQWPIGQESDFNGIVDLLTMQAYMWDDDDLGASAKEVPMPESVREQAEAARHAIIERIVETDDELMMRYLEEEEIPTEELKLALRAATLQSEVTPVFCGTALRNKGVQKVLDGIVHYLPSPLDVPPIEGVNPFTEAVEIREAKDEEPLSALVFKIVTDPYVGRLAYFRVYSGILKSGTAVNNSTKNRKERIGRILRMHADRREDLTEVHAGDIAAILGLKQTLYR